MITDRTTSLLRSARNDVVSARADLIQGHFDFAQCPCTDYKSGVERSRNALFAPITNRCQR
jgi:hypothetical protein